MLPAERKPWADYPFELRFKHSLRSREWYKQKRREKRQDPTRAEAVFWAAVRQRGGERPLGVKFRRQHRIGPYIVDFASPRARLAIEIDGSWHIGRELEDKRRQTEIEAAGWRVLRFTNEQVFKDLQTVLLQIRAELICM